MCFTIAAVVAGIVSLFILLLYITGHNRIDVIPLGHPDNPYDEEDEFAYYAEL